jgi:hypothetical protein
LPHTIFLQVSSTQIFASQKLLLSPLLNAIEKGFFIFEGRSFFLANFIIIFNSIESINKLVKQNFLDNLEEASLNKYLHDQLKELLDKKSKHK